MATSVATVLLRDSASRANALVDRYPIESSAVASTAHAIRLSRRVKPLSSELSVTPWDEQGPCPSHRRPERCKSREIKRTRTRMRQELRSWRRRRSAESAYG